MAKMLDIYLVSIWWIILCYWVITASNKQVATVLVIYPVNNSTKNVLLDIVFTFLLPLVIT